MLYPVGNGMTSAGSTLNLCKKKKKKMWGGREEGAV
jgi:hypothetical protein